MRKGEASWKRRERMLRGSGFQKGPALPGNQARGQMCGYAKEQEMRWPRGTGLHSASCALGDWWAHGPMSSWLPGEPEMAEGPDCTQVWLEISRAQGSLWGTGADRSPPSSVSVPTHMFACLWSSCPAPLLLAPVSGPGCLLPLPPSLHLPSILSHHLLPDLLLGCAT